MDCREYGQLPDGRVVHEYTLNNGLGLRLTAITLGGIVTGLWQVADQEREGRSLDYAAAAATLAEYAEAGFDSFDMADHYGGAEDIAGEAAEPADRMATQHPGDQQPESHRQQHPTGCRERCRLGGGVVDGGDGEAANERQQPHRDGQPGRHRARDQAAEPGGYRGFGPAAGQRHRQPSGDQRGEQGARTASGLDAAEQGADLEGDDEDQRGHPERPCAR